MSAVLEKHTTAIEHWLEPLFQKTPHLPHHLRETIASIAPWLALIGGVFGIVTVWGAGALSILLSFSFFGMGSEFLWMLALLILLAASILDLLAFSPLRARSKRGWNLLFYGVLLQAVSTVANLLIGYASLGGIIGLLIGLWLLFEMRGLYR